jgi:predicted exporter
MARLTHSRRIPAAFVLAAVLVAVAGLSRLRLESDVFALSTPPEPAWSAEDERVRARVSQMDPGRFVVAIGEDDESALQRNDAVFERLEDSRAAGELVAFQSLHSFLPSRSLQQHAWETLRRQPRLTERLLEALDSAGFRPDAFSAFVEAANGAAPKPLRFEDLEASPLSELVSGFRIDLGDRIAVLTRLRGVTQPTQLAARLADLEGVHYFDQQIFLQQIYGHYRTRTVRLIGVGLLAVIALLYARYRRLRVAFATAGPAILAAGTTLGALSLAGVAINLLHLLGLLLVLSIGVDYAIFLVASSASARAAALVGLVVACLSTCLAFGLLGLSSFPALQALGVTTLIGVFLSLLLAPSFLALALPAAATPGAPGTPAASPEAA